MMELVGGFLVGLILGAVGGYKYGAKAVAAVDEVKKL